MQNLNNPRPLPPNLTDQKILQELNLPVGTPIEQTTQESLQPRVIETEYGNFIPCKPEDVPSEKRAELLASLQPDETTKNALPSNDSIPPQIQTNENALPHQNTDEEDPSAPQTNSFVLNQTNDDVMPYFSISTGSPYGIPLDDPCLLYTSDFVVVSGITGILNFPISLIP